MRPQIPLTTRSRTVRSRSRRRQLKQRPRRRDRETEGAKTKARGDSYGSSAGVQSSTDTIVDYFREKNKESQALKTQKLALERERLELAKAEASERRDAEKEEREARRIAEREERESRRRKEEDDRMERRAMLDILCRLADKLK